jgi:hypothetical protein
VNVRPFSRFRFVALMLIAFAAGACSRVSHVPSATPDSLHAVRPDSLAMMARDVQAMWEAGNAQEDAARASAALLLADFGSRPSSQWEHRSHLLLDSLAVGAEIVAAPCILAVNFFERANPESGSWPWLFWCGDKKPHMQPIEGKGLHLQAAAVPPLRVIAPVTAPTVIPFAPAKSAAGGAAASAAPAPTAVAVFFQRRAGTGQEPLVMVWGHAKRDDPWNLTQTLGADSLGGIGTGEFAPNDTSLDIVTRTYQATRGFSECATCPHLYRTRRFRWNGTEFSKVADQIVSTPYATFVLFISALSVDDRDAAGKLVTDGSLVDRARKLDWGKPTGVWRIAPATDETPGSMVFFRGSSEAWRVQFAPQGTDWRISGFDVVPRSIE